MKTIRHFNDLANANYGWLNARYHFSFARYYDPAFVGFHNLLVVNDDRVQAGHGFDPHPHKDMEIITYVRSGEIRHGDNTGNTGVTTAGSVQVMSAGTGIVHSEAASDTEPTTLYQIWIEPRTMGVAPRWDMAQFPATPVEDALPLLVSGTKGEAPLFIHADAKLWGGKLATGTTITQNFGDKAYLLASKGDFTVNGETLKEGDAMQLESEGSLTLHAQAESEIVIIGLMG